jgi:Mn2+/Fe2+ NRAMP family transporter
MLLKNHRQIFSFCIKKRLYVHEGNVENHNGIRATIFGATGLMGQYVAGYLGYFGSQLVLPFNEEFNSYVAGDNIRELKNTAKPGIILII